MILLQAEGSFLLPGWLSVGGAIVMLLGGVFLALVRFTNLIDWWSHKRNSEHNPSTDAEPLITDPARLAQEVRKIEEEQEQQRTISLAQTGVIILLLAMVALVAVSLAGEPPPIPPTTTLP